MFEWLLKPIIDAVISKTLEASLDKVISQFASQDRAIAERMASMDEKLERLLAAHLKAASTFLRLGRFEQARDELVMAEANDPLSAVAKFWLGLVLVRAGMHDLGTEKCTEAFSMNPFVAGPNFLANQPVAELSEETTKLIQPWAHDLTDDTLFEQFQRQHTKIRRRSSYKKANTAVRQVSCNGLYALVLWNIDTEYAAAYPSEIETQSSSWHGQSFVSGFHIPRGTCLWHRHAHDLDLSYATPEFAILRLRENGRRRLLDVTSGVEKGEMSESYFRTVFSPYEGVLDELSSFSKANIRMLAPDIALKSCKKILGADYAPYADRRDITYTDSCVAKNPLLPGLFSIHSTNLWRLISFGGSMVSVGRNNFSCGATIALSGHSSTKQLQGAGPA